jgi:DNA-binding MarR family transcriptional regulator
MITAPLETIRLASVSLAQQKLIRADLTIRQLAIMLTCYHEPEPQTVRGLSAALSISRPAVTRGLDRLETEGLVKRQPEPGDNRSVIVAPTKTGSKMLAALDRAANGAPENRRAAA